jgi:2'-hydroxyisoflavone reductase
MKVLGARNIVWVSAEVLKANAVTEFELPLYRRTDSPRSSLMDVSNERAVEAGLNVSRPEATVKHVQAWLLKKNLPAALSPEREAALIARARRRESKGGVKKIS